MILTVRILAFDGNDQLDVTGPYEVLTRAAQILAENERPLGLDVQIVATPDSVATPDRVTSGGFGFATTQPWDPGAAPDVLVIPGGTREPRPDEPFTGTPQFHAAIRAQFEARRRIASVCIGAFGVAGACGDLIVNRHMTTHPAFWRQLRDTYGVDALDPELERVVDAGTIVSCGGVTAGIDLALYLLGTYWGDAPFAQDGGPPQTLEAHVRDFIDYHYVATASVYPS